MLRAGAPGRPYDLVSCVYIRPEAGIREHGPDKDDCVTGDSNLGPSPVLFPGLVEHAACQENLPLPL